MQRAPLVPFATHRRCGGRFWISGAALVVATACWAATALAHEPFSITTEARALRTELTLHVTMAGSTATLVCPEAAGGAKRLTPEALDGSRGAFERCAQQFFTIISSGTRSTAKSATVALTKEGDFDANVVYPIAPGALTLDAALLSGLSDPTYGVELTVTGEGVFLGQTVLRRDSRAYSVLPPSATADDSAESPAASASVGRHTAETTARAAARPTNESVLSAHRRPTLYVMIIALVTAAIVAWRLARSR